MWVQVGIRPRELPRAFIAHAKAAYASGVSAPGPSPIRRLVWGTTLPIAGARAVVRDRATFARYLDVVVTQVAFVVALTATVALVAAGTWWEHARHDHGAAHALLEVLSTLYATASIVEWAVVALSRDFHEELTWRASYLTAAPCDPLVEAPRVRLNTGWLWRKVWRRARRALLLASGLPAAALVLVLPQVGPYLYLALGAAWTGYWFAVFAIGSAPDACLASAAPAPWFVRAALTIGSVPFFGIPARLYAAIWRRLSAPVDPACAAVEAAPYEAAGLAIARAVASLPGLYIVTRPLFPVAAAHALRARQRA
jgi:hypothetical protein